MPDEWDMYKWSNTVDQIENPNYVLHTAHKHWYMMGMISETIVTMVDLH